VHAIPVHSNSARQPDSVEWNPVDKPFNKPESKTGRASGFADLHNSNAVPRSPGSKAIDLKCRSGESEAAKSGPETAPIGVSEN
jgi:hypothetical protein